MLPPSDEPEPAKVSVYDDLIWAWNAFWRLSASRDLGFDRPIRIKVSEIKAYAELQGFAPWKMRELFFYVDKLDERWMEHVAKLRDEEEEKRKKKTNDHTPGRPPQKRQR